ncbi:MAG: TlpA family protein disulfide reductase [Maribacter sp.]
MKIKRETLSNFAFIILAVLLLFTPLGFHARVLVAKIFSFSPSPVQDEKQLLLTDYSWKLSSIDNESLNFEDLEGKVVLLNYWATWCPPCVAEMPSLQELHDDYGKKVAFVFVAHDKREKVKNFLTKNQFDLPVYFEKSNSPEILSTESIPTTFIVDKKGKIVVAETGAVNWNSTGTRELLETLLNE